MVLVTRRSPPPTSGDDPSRARRSIGSSTSIEIFAGNGKRMGGARMVKQAGGPGTGGSPFRRKRRAEPQPLGQPAPATEEEGRLLAADRHHRHDRDAVLQCQANEAGPVGEVDLVG